MNRLLVVATFVSGLSLTLMSCCPNPCISGKCSSGVQDAQHPIDKEKELMIRDLSVVESTRATGPTGPWSFGGLIERMRGSQTASAFVIAWLKTWEASQTVNSFTVAPRPSIRSTVIEPWKAKDGQPGVADEQWQMNLANAPFRLLAIVNRLDLRHSNEAQIEDAGEGRFVFGVVDANGAPLQFTVIFEYELPAATCAEVQAWAECWHSLGSLPFGEAYNAALERVTDRFTKAGASISKPNRSALNQIRTNEIALNIPWELREFNISSNSGLLREVSVKQTPDFNRFSGRPELTAFLQQNQANVLAQAHEVPLTFGGVPFRGGASHAGPPPVPLVWSAPGADPQALRLFALNTCNGCHLQVTGTAFTHVSPRALGSVAQLSAFLDAPTGAPGTPAEFNNDLQRRASDMLNIINQGNGACGGGIVPFRVMGGPDGAQPAPLPNFLRNRAAPSRVH